MKVNLCRLLLSLSGALFLIQHASAFDVNARNNLVNYWGQNGANSEGDLAEYCHDDTIDILVLAFLDDVRDGFPGLDFANHCTETYPGSTILHCPKMARDIKYCQLQGKVVILSIGGASGSYSISDNAEGQAFAQTIWDLFLGGSSDTRPFEDAELDGVDLDLEGGATQGYVGFLQALREKFSRSSDTRRYYVTGAPQCPMPDQWIEPMMAASWFDMLFVQFYNNDCGADRNNFNFEAWNDWATSSTNKNVKIFLGVPGGPGAAGSNVLDAGQLKEIIDKVQSYSNFGGVMMWDAGYAQVSGLAAVAALAMDGGGGGSSPIMSPSSSPPRTSPQEPSPDDPEPGSLIPEDPESETTMPDNPFPKDPEDSDNPFPKDPEDPEGSCPEDPEDLETSWPEDPENPWPEIPEIP
ncbi:Chitinase 1 [Mortierella sp. GBA30]|nr:Chitinase 1 [Mortierella sp. GBA30]